MATGERTGTSGAIAAAQNIGGQRTVARRRLGTGSSGASSASMKPRQPAASAGIFKFYTDDSPGFKVGPQTVLVLTLVFMAVVVILHIFGKFRQAYES